MPRIAGSLAFGSREMFLFDFVTSRAVLKHKYWWGRSTKGIEIDGQGGWDAGAAFEALYRQYFSLVVTVIRGRVSDLEEAEDLAMTVFELAWARYRDGEQVGLPWLYGCARNVVGNEYQRRERVGKLRFRIAALHKTNIITLPVEKDVELAAAIRRLPVTDRELIAMVYWYDLTVREAAEILSVSEAATKMRLSRLRRRLKIHLTSSQGLTEAAQNG